MDELEISVNDETMEAEPIEKLLGKFGNYTKTLDSYDIHFDSMLLRQIIEGSGINAETVHDKDKLKKEIENLDEYFKARETKNLKKYKFTVEEDSLQKNVIKVNVMTSSKEKKFKLNTYFFESAEFANLVNNYQGIRRYLKAKFSITKKKDETKKFDSLEGFSDFILENGKQGAYIQRYKGLGEMNPEQLWDTTMDVKNRNLLRVQIEDMLEADSIFSILMGDNVGPRKQFVEENNLSVRNLDV